MARIHILALDATRQGGAGVYTENLASQLAQSGHCVTLICHDASEKVRHGCSVLVIPRPAKNHAMGLWRFDAVLQLADYRRNIGTLTLPPADLVIGSAQPMVHAYRNRFPLTPLIYIPHSMVAPLELASYGFADKVQRFAMIEIYRYLEKRCLKAAACTIRFSQKAAHTLVDYYGTAAIRGEMTVLPMPIEQPLLLAKKGSGNKLRLLTIGRLISSKNIAFLIQTLSNLKHHSWVLDIVGDGPEKNLLQDMVDSVALAERVIFHGHSDNVGHFYQSADLFLFPSKLESHGIVVIEAMSYQVPVLAFRADNAQYINVNEELIDHCKDGLLAADEREYFSLLDQCLIEEINLKPLAEAATIRVRANNSWQSHCEKISNLIDKLIL